MLTTKAPGICEHRMMGAKSLMESKGMLYSAGLMVSGLVVPNSSV